MPKTPRSRRLIALLAAYAVALQALLLPLSVAAGAAPDFSLCAASTGTASPQSDTGHPTGCPCAAGCGMQCCGQALAGPPRAVILVVRTSSRQLTPPPTPASLTRPPLRGPQLARAPPSA